jgi:hypothetical protein
MNMSEQVLAVKGNGSDQQHNIGSEPARTFDAKSLQAQSGIALRNTVTLSVQGGRCFLARSATVMGNYDFVGLYENSAITDPWGAKTWKWATQGGFPFATGKDAAVGNVGMYFSYNYEAGHYVRTAVTAPLTSEIIANNGSVSGSTTC